MRATSATLTKRWHGPATIWKIGTAAQHQTLTSNNVRLPPQYSGYLREMPDNERSQFRWNQPAFGAGDSSPRIAEGQLAGGKSVEFDTGAWVLPYWMARHYGIIAPPPR